MLLPIDDQLWHATHAFTANGLPLSSRMTVARLPGGLLWLHSPIPVTDALRAELDALGRVAYIVAPSKTHHLFVAGWLAAYPQAGVYGAPGLAAKRPDLVGLQTLQADGPAPWAPDLQHLLVDGIPFGNETLWFHAPSATLIVTDLLQWWQGDLPWAARCYARLTGVRRGLGVPRTVRALVRDVEAVRASMAQVQRWPFRRVVLAHNAIVDVDAQARVAEALRVWA